MINHSLLHPTLTDRELDDGCQLALRKLDGVIRVRDIGATRCGASVTAAIFEECLRRQSGASNRAPAALQSASGY